MANKKIPHTAQEFNRLLENGEFGTVDFWLNFYDFENKFDELLGYKKNEELTYYFLAVKGYYVYIEMIKNKKFTEIIKIHAKESVLDFICQNEKSAWNYIVNSDTYKKKNQIQKSKPHNRYVNYLIIDRSFKSIIDIVSEYFKSCNLYPLDSDDRIMRGTDLKSIWNSDEVNHQNDFQLYASLHPRSGGLMDLEITIGLINMHEVLKNNILSPVQDFDDVDYFDDRDIFIPEISIPSTVYERCKDVPHLIKIEFAINEFNSFFDNGILMDLALQFGDRAYLITPDSNIRGFKSNKHIPASEKMFFLYEYTDQYFSNTTLENASLDIKNEIGQIWYLLDENSKTFLTTGYFLYKHTISGSRNLLDISQASLAFSKCIENEMVKKIVLPFKEHYQLYFLNEDMTKDLEDINLKKMASFLNSRTLTPPELGSFNYFLNQVINSKNRAKWSVSIRAFKSFCEKLENPNFILDKNSIWTMFNKISKKYRNGSAHIKVLPIEDLIEFHDILFSKKEQFLKKFINSTRLKNMVE